MALMYYIKILQLHDQREEVGFLDTVKNKYLS